MKIDVYSDLVCPWCYIGERRLARALAELPGGEEIEVRFRPYQLDPDTPDSPVPLVEHLRRKFGAVAPAMMARVGEAAAGEGIAIDWDRAIRANTTKAHRLLALAARRHGAAMQHDVAERLFELHFARGGDLGNVDQLAAAASAAGMDPAEVRDYLRSGEGEEELGAELDAVRQLGIRAVPTFVIDGRWAIEGAQPPAVLVEALERARVLSAPPRHTA